MPEIELVINTKVGLHARPAALFVQLAKQFASDIRIINSGKEANAKSILSVLSLGVYHGTKICLTAQGDDADEALAALQELIETNFGEPE
jgi:phosphotransferase system HPr (HPr) family protein